MLRHNTLQDLEVSELCFGGNVFGWTVSETEAFDLLDAYRALDGNFIDTADSYPFWATGTDGGESEMIIGSWLAARKNRDEVVIATKVGEKPDRSGLAGSNIHRAVDESLVRLGVDTIDLLYAHVDDPSTPLEETLSAFNALVAQGKVRYVGLSKYSAHRLQEAVDCQARNGFVPIVALQPNYNLAKRDIFEGSLQRICLESGIATFPFAALASGFLTGKYRKPESTESVRSRFVESYADPRGDRLLDVMERIAGVHEVPLAAIALAWLRSQPSVVAPIASARTAAQLSELAQMSDVQLSAADLADLDAGSAS